MLELICPIEHPHIKEVRENVLSQYLYNFIDRNDLVNIKEEVSDAIRCGYDSGRIFPPGVNHSSIPDQLYLEWAQMNDPSIRISDIISTEFDVGFDPIDGTLKIKLTVMLDREEEEENKCLEQR
jgi:hypothetical protein